MRSWHLSLSASVLLRLELSEAFTYKLHLWYAHTLSEYLSSKSSMCIKVVGTCDLACIDLQTGQKSLCAVFTDEHSECV